MSVGRPDREELLARRAAWTRHRRRRRLALALLACAAGAASLGLGIRAGLSKPTAATTGPTARSAAVTGKPGPKRARPAPSLVRGPLGSGKPVTLAFGGDVHFESPIRERLAASPSSVLGPVARILDRADLAMVNLETAVTDRGTAESKEYVFRAPSTAFSALKAGGVDVVTVANNHGMDFGASGLRDTLAAARRAGVELVGAGRNDRQAYAPYRVTVNGQRIAVIGATQVIDTSLIADWTAGPHKLGLASAKDAARLVRAVREARATSDTVVVFLHWGRELTACPTPVQTSLAAGLAAAGADVIVGSHAHVLLGAGQLGEAFVDYGLGNFVFYATRDVALRSGVLEVTVTGRRVDGYRWVPARISGGIPHPLSGVARAKAVSAWRSLRSCTDLRP